MTDYFTLEIISKQYSTEILIKKFLSIEDTNLYIKNKNKEKYILGKPTNNLEMYIYNILFYENIFEIDLPIIIISNNYFWKEKQNMNIIEKYIFIYSFN
jgi:hypothetical protein